MSALSGFKRIFSFILICILFAQCTDRKPQETTTKGQRGSRASTGTEPAKARYQVIDEVPRKVRELDNVTVFEELTEATHTLVLIPVQDYGKEGDPYLIKVFESIIDNTGRVIILNNASNYEPQVYVYNEDGSFRNELGGPGQGPGEYGWPMSIQNREEQIFLYDSRNKRYNIYNTTDYTIERTLVQEQLKIREEEAVQGLEFGVVFALDDGNFLVSFYERVSDTGWPVTKFLLMDPDGNALDYNIPEFKGSFKANGEVESTPVPMTFMPMPFMGSIRRIVTREGELYSAWNMDFLIKKYDKKGSYHSAIYYPLSGTPFNIDDHTPTSFYDKDDVMKALEIHDEELPENNPVIRMMRADGAGRIWVAIPAGNERWVNEWWILEESGELRARLMMSKGRQIMDIKGNEILIRETNEETETDYVVKYRMEWNEAKGQ